jgi:hypothetical protein
MPQKGNVIAPHNLFCRFKKTGHGVENIGPGEPVAILF